MSINCFEWQNRSSDYLDGTLMGTAREEADQHLEGCGRCNDRFRHYRLILGSISSQPRSGLPIPIRKSPFAFTMPRVDMRGHRSRWQAAPWYVRSGAEGLGIAFLVLFVVAMVPRVRTLYERNVERRLEPFSLAELPNDSDALKDQPKLARGKTLTTEPGHDFNSEDDTDEQVDEDETSASTVIFDGKEVRVGSSEIWRFNLRTDSPHDVRAKVVQALSDNRLSSDTPGIGGVEAPGGIQFDVLVPVAAVANLKHQLQRIAGNNPSGAAGAPHDSLSETFTWYRNKSKQKIPPGKARVVIWLSQI